MSWLSAIGSSFHFLLFYLTIGFYLFIQVLSMIFNLALVAIAPFTHLVSYVAHGLLIPIRFLSNFETLYVYLGVAALIGLLTGSILHFSSTMLIRLLGLQPSSPYTSHTAASVCAARKNRQLEDAWNFPTPVGHPRGRKRLEDPLKEHSEYLNKDRGKRRNGHGLLSQTILEEDDDSEAGF